MLQVQHSNVDCGEKEILAWRSRRSRPQPCRRNGDAFAATLTGSTPILAVGPAGILPDDATATS
jgi:hypothetical protein